MKLANYYFALTTAYISSQNGSGLACCSTFFGGEIKVKYCWWKKSSASWVANYCQTISNIFENGFIVGLTIYQLVQDFFHPHHDFPNKDVQSFCLYAYWPWGRLFLFAAAACPTLAPNAWLSRVGQIVLEMRTVLVGDGGTKLEGQSRSFHRPQVVELLRGWWLGTSGR